MSANEMKDCVACRHSIDAGAKICPYCGADPDTGEKVDTKPLVEAHFPPRRERGATESMMSFLRQRQGVVVTVVVLACFLVLTVVHQLVVRRNDAQTNDVPAIPLTEIADLTRQSEKSAEAALPALDFSYDGNARTMQTFLIEPGAVPPPQAMQQPAPAPVVGAQPATQRPLAFRPVADNGVKVLSPPLGGLQPAPLRSSKLNPVSPSTGFFPARPAGPQPQTTTPATATTPTDQDETDTTTEDDDGGR